MAVEAAFDSSIDRDDDGLLGTRDQPGRHFAAPAVGALTLEAIADFLAKETELVINPVGVAGEIQRRERIEKAGGEAAEAAIAEGGIGFFIEKRGQVDAVFGEEIAADIED